MTISLWPFASKAQQPRRRFAFPKIADLKAMALASFAAWSDAHVSMSTEAFEIADILNTPKGFQTLSLGDSTQDSGLMASIQEARRRNALAHASNKDIAPTEVDKATQKPGIVENIIDNTAQLTKDYDTAPLPIKDIAPTEVNNMAQESKIIDNSKNTTQSTEDQATTPLPIKDTSPAEDTTLTEDTSPTEVDTITQESNIVDGHKDTAQSAHGQATTPVSVEDNKSAEVAEVSHKDDLIHDVDNSEDTAKPTEDQATAPLLTEDIDTQVAKVCDQNNLVQDILTIINGKHQDNTVSQVAKVSRQDDSIQDIDINTPDDDHDDDASYIADVESYAIKREAAIRSFEAIERSIKREAAIRSFEAIERSIKKQRETRIYFPTVVYTTDFVEVNLSKTTEITNVAADEEHDDDTSSIPDEESFTAKREAAIRSFEAIERSIKDQRETRVYFPTIIHTTDIIEVNLSRTPKITDVADVEDMGVSASSIGHDFERFLKEDKMQWVQDVPNHPEVCTALFKIKKQVVKDTKTSTQDKIVIAAAIQSLVENKTEDIAAQEKQVDIQAAIVHHVRRLTNESNSSTETDKTTSTVSTGSDDTRSTTPDTPDTECATPDTSICAIDDNKKPQEADELAHLYNYGQCSPADFDVTLILERLELNRRYVQMTCSYWYALEDDDEIRPMSQAEYQEFLEWNSRTPVVTREEFDKRQQADAEKGVITDTNVGIIERYDDEEESNVESDIEKASSCDIEQNHANRPEE